MLAVKSASAAATMAVITILIQLYHHSSGQAAQGRASPYEGSVRSATGPQSQLSASSRARASTASIIASVSLPVNVFCWLGW